jgi:transposase-like protein
MFSETINLQQENMITMVMQGENITSIAKKLNITRGTVYSWLNKDNIKAELDKRRQDIVTQGNNCILKDIKSYIENIKELANDKTDKRVCLAANQYLINRIYGNPTSIIDTGDCNQDNPTDANQLKTLLYKFKNTKIK